MNIRRDGRPAPSSEGGPYRPMWVENEDVKVYYELTEEEVKEAVIEWLQTYHNVQTSQARLLFTYDNTVGNNNSSKTEKKALLSTYTLTIEDER